MSDADTNLAENPPKSPCVRLVNKRTDGITLGQQERQGPKDQHFEGGRRQSH